MKNARRPRRDHRRRSHRSPIRRASWCRHGIRSGIRSAQRKAHTRLTYEIVEQPGRRVLASPSLTTLQVRTDDLAKMVSGEIQEAGGGWSFVLKRSQVAARNRAASARCSRRSSSWRGSLLAQRGDRIHPDRPAGRIAQAVSATTPRIAIVAPNVGQSVVEIPYRKFASEPAPANRRPGRYDAERDEHIPSRTTSGNTAAGPRRAPSGCPSRACAGRSRTPARRRCRSPRAAGPGRRTRRAATRPCARRRARCRSSRSSSGCPAAAGWARAPGSRGGPPATSAPGGRSAHVERHAGLVVLRQRQVDHRARASSVSVAVLAVAHDAHDLAPRPFRPVEADALAERVRAGEVHAPRLVHDDHGRPALASRLVEVAAVQQRDAERLEEAGRRRSR